jgi:hypothetical protein
MQQAAQRIMHAVLVVLPVVVCGCGAVCCYVLLVLQQ